MNKLSQQATALSQILAANRLTKSADQKIKHESLYNQHSLGAEQTREIDENIPGVIASTDAAKNDSSDQVQDIPGVQDLNKNPESALQSTGTDVKDIAPDGQSTGTPAQVAKTASLYQARLGNILASMRKTAAAKQATKAGEAPQEITSATEVLHKFASLNEKSTKEDIADAQATLQKLASNNPFFQQVRDNILMHKLAEDVEALAEAEGIPEEQAAELMDAAAADEPEIAQEAEDEATGEAVAELADAESATDELMGGIQEMAANASANLGVEVSPEDIMDAAEQTQAMADELGVPPEALIQAAMEDLTAAQEGGDEPTEEDMANAQQILDEAAQNGISPEEVIQMAADELGGTEGEGEGEEAPAQAEDEGVEKAASLQKRASTRASYVSHLLHSR